MVDKFDVMSAVKGDEKTVFYMPKNNYYVAGKATLAEGEIYSNTTNMEYIGYNRLDITGKNIAVVYAIWVKSWIGATIMTMKAYKKLRRIPSLEEIKQENVYYSYEDRDTLLNLTEAITLTLFGIIETFYRTNAFLEITMMLVTFGIIYLVLSHELRPFVGGYRMKKPNDRQIEVAREALKEYDAMLEKVNQNSDSKFFNPTNVGNDFDKCYGMLFSVEMDK